MKKHSLIALFSVFVFLILAHFQYPKWTKTQAEATISYDVSGYYMYLPAVFIYHDLKNFSYKKTVLAKYKPTPNNNQAFQHESGNFVMKYSMGQAISFSPFFFVAHLWASVSSRTRQLRHLTLQLQDCTPNCRPRLCLGGMYYYNIILYYIILCRLISPNVIILYYVILYNQP